MELRTIKFRGKCSHCDAWAYGSLVYLGEDEPPEIHGFDPFREGTTAWREITVDRETVGQFTGCLDKNGKEIYEGDIVECVSWNEYFSDGKGKPLEPFRRKMVVVYCNGGFKLLEPMPLSMTDNYWDFIYNGDVVVIGNIHDNPDLIKR